MDTTTPLTALERFINERELVTGRIKNAYKLALTALTRFKSSLWPCVVVWYTPPPLLLPYSALLDVALAALAVWESSFTWLAASGSGSLPTGSPDLNLRSMISSSILS